MKKKLSVYVVDDGDDYRLLVRNLFARFLTQYEAHFFASGSDLSAHIINDSATDRANLSLPLPTIPRPDLSRPGLILLDYHMPGMNGLDTLECIKKNVRWRHIPVVMMSSSSSQEEANACYEAGASSFLTKPMDTDKLREVLGQVCHYWLDVNQSRVN